MKVKRKIIEIDESRCDGCGNCIPACAEGAIQLVDGKAKVVSDKFCDGLGACLGECPNNALRVIEREAEEFDEEAVEEYLKSRLHEPLRPASTVISGCPSAQARCFGNPLPRAKGGPAPLSGTVGSRLTHWPIKIRLVPPQAPFLQGADLLVVADCAGVAYPAFHQEFLAGKVVLMGCPKFDDTEMYVQKFSEIFFRAAVRSVTVVVMEVPCCHGLPYIVKKGMERAAQEIPIEVAVISAQGTILERRRVA